MAAAWPRWEFAKLQDARTGLHFTNHSAIGDLHEDIPIGTEYEWKDGHRNCYTCVATWVNSAEGGTLSITRSGKAASYSEVRIVCDNSLTFELTHENGVQWGRVFVRGAT
mmetsp:Transcript_63227/g.193409  ORF Transcript_63227/g.193409 Transcript_63227/m.193409 type:complete len:110 (-) Transcript_63227:80-409(-)